MQQTRNNRDLPVAQNVETLCACGSGRIDGECCRPLVEGRQSAATAEALMRSRYSAYVFGHVDYLKDTLHPKERKGFDADGTAQFCRSVIWTGLEILERTQGQRGDKTGTVRFVARFMRGGEAEEIAENSLFKRVAGRWFYVKALRS